MGGSNGSGRGVGGGPPKGSQNHRTHGLTPVLKPGRHKRRKAIDTRFREGKETVAFRASLIAMKGGESEINAHTARRG